MNNIVNDFVKISYFRVDCFYFLQLGVFFFSHELTNFTHLDVDKFYRMTQICPKGQLDLSADRQVSEIGLHQSTSKLVKFVNSWLKIII